MCRMAAFSIWIEAKSCPVETENFSMAPPSKAKEMILCPLSVKIIPRGAA